MPRPADDARGHRRGRGRPSRGRRCRDHRRGPAVEASPTHLEPAAWNPGGIIDPRHHRRGTVPIPARPRSPPSDRGIDVCRANGVEHAAACTGSTSEAAVRAARSVCRTMRSSTWGISPAARWNICASSRRAAHHRGGFGKLSKPPAGPWIFHSGRSEGADTQQLTAALLSLGAEPRLATAARSADTAGEILGMARASGLALGGPSRRSARPGPGHGDAQSRHRGHRHRSRRRGRGSCRILGGLDSRSAPARPATCR